MVALNDGRARWLGVFSTTGVYGDRAGGWAFEEDDVTPQSAEAHGRVRQEAAWLALGAEVFRLPGIYGPGRSAFDRLKAGTAQRIVKQGQVFSRIHVDDIASAVEAAILRPGARRILNIVDDMPAPPQDVITHAAALFGVAPPPEIAIADGALSPMAARFYAESKRVSNAKAKGTLGWMPRFATYREGLKAILEG
jgi:nucleoside-diphosphate-sugar epimerase